MTGDGGVPLTDSAEAGFRDGAVEGGEGSDGTRTTKLFPDEVKEGAPCLARPRDRDGTILGEGGEVGEGFVGEGAPTRGAASCRSRYQYMY